MRLGGLPKLLILWSGRRDSNPRRPAWEAGILPLNYSRDSRVSRAVRGGIERTLASGFYTIAQLHYSTPSVQRPLRTPHEMGRYGRVPCRPRAVRTCALFRICCQGTARHPAGRRAGFAVRRCWRAIHPVPTSPARLLPLSWLYHEIAEDGPDSCGERGLVRDRIPLDISVRRAATAGFHRVRTFAGPVAQSFPAVAVTGRTNGMPPGPICTTLSA